MERKPKSVGVVVTAAEIREALPKAKLGREEEKALRMRYGIAPDSNAALSWAASGNAADELLLIEMELVKAQLQRSAAHRGRTGPQNRPKLESSAQKAREKILRALRKKR